jgi:hypothetical protein
MEMKEIRHYITEYVGTGLPDMFSDAVKAEFCASHLGDIDVIVKKGAQSKRVSLDTFLNTGRNADCVTQALIKKGILRSSELVYGKKINRSDLYFILKDYFGKKKPPFDIITGNNGVLSVNPEY